MIHLDDYTEAMRHQATKIRLSYALRGFMLSLTLVGMTPGANGQAPDFKVQKWTMYDGLIDSSLAGVARVPNGFLWMSTTKGLVRFDGAQFKTFTGTDLPGLGSGHSSDMVVGPDGQLYVAVEAGLLILGEHAEKIVRTTAGTKPDPVQVVLPVGRNEAWFGTVAGYLYHYREGTTEAIGPEKLSGDTVYGLAKTSDGTLWIGTGNGLFLSARGNISRFSPPVKLPVGGFFDLAVTDSGSIFAATDEGVLQIRGADWRFWTMKDGLPGDHIQVLAAAPGDTLWIGTNSGLAQLVRGKAQTIKMCDCSVGGLSVDPDHSLWVGCEHAGGLLHVFHPEVRLHSVSAKFSVPRVSSLVEDKNGIVWMASAHGLLRWQHGKSRLYTEKDGLVPDVIDSVSLAPNGDIWMTGADGFARMHDGKIETFRTQAPGPQDPVFSVLEDSKGTLWVGTPKALLSRPRGQTKLEVIPTVEARVWSVREDREGNIWVSTHDKGLYRISASSETHFTTSEGLASDMVSDTLEDANGDIWVATSDGLSRIRDGRCKSIKQINETQIGHIDSFASDLAGHLWLRLENAAVVVDISEANHVIDEGGGLTQSHVYGFDDGFRDQLLHVSAGNGVIRHSSGEMWFPTAGGFASIDPKELNHSVSTIHPRVTFFASDVGEHRLQSQISVRPGDHRIQFAYTAPTMNGASSLEFRYRLMGFDKSWQAGGKEREAVYTSLLPGSYSLLLSVRRPFESWVDSSTPLEVRILPHFYQTWWWYALAALTLTSVLLLSYFLRVRALQRQFSILMSERLRERSRLARELHDTLSQGMVGIHLQIEAAQVLLDVDPKSVRRHLENVGRLALEASVETRKSIAELRSGENEVPSLSRVLHKAASDFSRSCIVALDAEINEDLPRFGGGVIHEISRILEEALANVRLHSGAQHAFLSAGRSASHFLLEVRDDGKGFKTEASKILPDHFGITGMHERALRINGRLHLTSEPNKGTRVTLAVPLRARWHSFLALDFLLTIPLVRNLFHPDLR